MGTEWRDLGTGIGPNKQEAKKIACQSALIKISERLVNEWREIHAKLDLNFVSNEVLKEVSEALYIVEKEPDLSCYSAEQLQRFEANTDAPIDDYRLLTPLKNHLCQPYNPLSLFNTLKSKEDALKTSKETQNESLFKLEVTETNISDEG